MLSLLPERKTTIEKRSMPTNESQIVEYSRFFRFFENIIATPSYRRNFASDSVEGAPSNSPKRERQASGSAHRKGSETLN